MESLFIILVDFNKAELNHTLPIYRLHTNCPTTYWTTTPQFLDAYHSVLQAALGQSYHCLVNLIPTYKQKLKSVQPVVKTVKKWTRETKQELQDCFDWTDWSVFEAASGRTWMN